MIALIIVALVSAWIGDWLEVTVMAISALVVIWTHVKARHDQLDLAANVLLLNCTLLLVVLMFTGSGLRDSSLLGIPGLLIFSVMLGRRRISIILLLLFLATFFVFAGLYHFGLLANPTPLTGVRTAIFLSVITILVSFSIFSLHGDLLKLLDRLRAEVKRVAASQAETEFLAQHDALTGLPNRTLARDRLDHALKMAAREGRRVALIYLDLDDFKSINDSLGHQAGDELLVQLAQALKTNLRESDTICRLGGDEFLVIAETQSDEFVLTQMAEKILGLLSANYLVRGAELQCSGSLGIAVAPADGNDFETLLKRADIAMYHAKESGRNTYRFFDEKQQGEMQKRLEMIAELRYAIQYNEISVLYQPKYDLANGKIIGAEALLRWNNRTFGFVSPAVFIALAEKAGLISELGEWVLHAACRDMALFRQHTGKDLHLAVNVSVPQILRPNLVQQIQSALQQSNLPVHALELEITESLLVEDVKEVIENLRAIRQLGVGLAIDDFGTGYSNLGYLKRFDVQVLKIDRSFIDGLADNPENQTIVKAVIQLAIGLSMDVVAEGIEQVEALQLLQYWGCHMGQGYYWSKPISVQDFLLLLEKSP